MGFNLLGQSSSAGFPGRVGYGCLGLGCLELRVFLSFRCLLGLRGLSLGCGRLFCALGGFSFSDLASCFLLGLGRLKLRLLMLGRFLCRCCLICFGRRTPLPALGGVGFAVSLAPLALLAPVLEAACSLRFAD